MLLYCVPTFVCILLRNFAVGVSLLGGSSIQFYTIRLHKRQIGERLGFSALCKTLILQLKR